MRTTLQTKDPNALVYKENANGQTQICYITRGESVPEHSKKVKVLS